MIRICAWILLLLLAVAFAGGYGELIYVLNQEVQAQQIVIVRDELAITEVKGVLAEINSQLEHRR